jgi:hypothetical protein
MTDYKPAKLKSYDQTIRGLLAKRVELCHQAQELRRLQATASSEIAAIDRVLSLLGFEADYDALMPKNVGKKQHKRGEIGRKVSSILRTATEPVTSRQIALQIAQQRGDNPNDHAHMVKLTNNVSRVLGGMRKQGRVVSEGSGNGVQLWRLSHSAFVKLD